ncbi:MAG: hypothetical protein Q8M07_16190, partial [Prosthecobacter sp.]|nr:hypothetical protein [Prosthecobacter sp.]
MDSDVIPPQWFTLSEKLMWPLIGMSAAAARANAAAVSGLEPASELAFCHHAGCMEASIHINRRGKHATAICLIRQSIEALTIGEIGLQHPGFARALLAEWKEGARSQGQLRRALEAEIWPSYGVGLWDEPWAVFYANLARAVQSYAHYTPELQGWQWCFVAHGESGRWIGKHGPETYDAIKASRITLFHALLTWMLGRILIASGKSADALLLQREVKELGDALGRSKLLFARGEWW